MHGYIIVYIFMHYSDTLYVVAIDSCIHYNVDNIIPWSLPHRDTSSVKFTSFTDALSAAPAKDRKSGVVASARA